jgi:hypothetical protein
MLEMPPWLELNAVQLYMDFDLMVHFLFLVYQRVQFVGMDIPRYTPTVWLVYSHRAIGYLDIWIFKYKS